MREHALDVHSVLLVRGGKVVVDATFFPYSRQSVHDLASITKSVTATLVGIAASRGLVDVHRPVLDFFPGLRVDDPGGAKRKLRVEHLLNMTSGLDCGLQRGEVELFRMISSHDWTRFTLDLPLRSRPGTSFAYCSPNFHLLSAILTQVTGENELAFARRELFEPLGIREVVWPSGPADLTLGWGDLRLLPRDVAKLGFLYLHGGRWEGRQLLDPGWVEASARPLVQTGGKEAYSHGWWVSTGELRGLVSARGRGGQFLAIWPKRDLIAVFTGSGYDLDQLGRGIVAALRSDRPLPENPAALKRLEQVSEEVARPPAGSTPPPLPEAARRISWRAWKVEDNRLGIRSLSLSFGDAATASASLRVGDAAQTFAVGLDGVWRVAPGGRFGLPVAARGSWTGPEQFTFELDEIANVNHWRMTVEVRDDDSLAIRLGEQTGLLGGETLLLRGSPAP